MGKKTDLKKKKATSAKSTSKPVSKTAAKKTIKKDLSVKKPGTPKNGDSKKKKVVPAGKIKTSPAKGTEKSKKKGKSTPPNGKKLQSQKDFFSVEDDEEEKEKQETDEVEETEIEFIEEDSNIEDLRGLDDDDDDEDEFYGGDDY